jgi:hypothetical protein
MQWVGEVAGIDDVGVAVCVVLGTWVGINFVCDLGVQG